jgi:hypothetical protein
LCGKRRRSHDGQSSLIKNGSAAGAEKRCELSNPE